MPIETERKFRIRENREISFTLSLGQLYSSMEALIDDVMENGTPIRQGYLSLEHGAFLAKGLNMQPDFKIVEARLRDKGSKFIFTIKGDGTLSRGELEREVSNTIFDNYWPLTEGKRVEKIRLKRPVTQSLYAEIDLYTDRDLILAEVEGDPNTIYELLPIGEDVTENKKYKNKNLAQ